MIAKKLHTLDAETIYKVVRQLIGKITPCGESNSDSDAYDNLEILLELTEKLIANIDTVAYYNKDRQESSMRKIGALANKWIKKHLAE